MQKFHQFIPVKGPIGPYNMITPARYENSEQMAIDWPTKLIVGGKTYTCTLTDSEQQKWDKYRMRPWNGHGPQIAIRDERGIMVLVYRTVTTSPSWSLREEFTPVRETDLGYVHKQGIPEPMPADTQKRIELIFLASTIYAPVNQTNSFADGIESVWNRGKAYDASSEAAKSDAAERELYGGRTWQEQHDDL